VPVRYLSLRSTHIISIWDFSQQARLFQIGYETARKSDGPKQEITPVMDSPVGAGRFSFNFATATAIPGAVPLSTKPCFSKCIPRSTGLVDGHVHQSNDDFFHRQAAEMPIFREFAKRSWRHDKNLGVLRALAVNSV
jgi:hypothetical protein